MSLKMEVTILVQRKKTGNLDGLIISVQRFSEKLGVSGAHSRNEFSTSSARKIGPARPRGREAGRQIAGRQ